MGHLKETKIKGMMTFFLSSMIQVGKNNGQNSSEVMVVIGPEE